MIRKKRNSQTKIGPGYRKIHLIRHWLTWHDDYNQWRQTFAVSALARIKLRDEIYMLQPARLKKIIWPNGLEIPVKIIEENFSSSPPAPSPAI